MNTLFTILAVVVLLAGILLIAVVLLQNGKGDGLASNFVAGNQTFGVRKTADILEKVTWILVAVILVLSIFSAFALKSEKNVDVRDNVIESVEATQAPAFPEGQILEQEAPSTEAAPAAETKAE